ncbi:MAG TPA: hypothetical protein VGC70_03105, partial [Burkholderiales bacterium]
AYWDLRARPKPLGPAALRDSINAARVRKQREDSVRAARGDTTSGSPQTLPAGTDTTQRRAPGRRAQGASATGEINLRPAEGPIGGAAAGGGEGGGGFGGARNGNLVDPGDYVVTITAGGQTMRQFVHVERVGEIINSDFSPDEDEDAAAEPIDP